MNFFINFMTSAGVTNSAQVPNSPQGAQASSGGFMGMLPMLIIFAVFIFILYFFSIRPNKKKEKEQKDKLSKLKKGDRVQTIGGWRGTVCDIKDKTVILKIDENAKIEIIKEGIYDVISVVEKETPSQEKKSLQSDNNQGDKK